MEQHKDLGHLAAPSGPVPSAASEDAARPVAGAASTEQETPTTDEEVWSSDEETFYEFSDFIDMKAEGLEPGHVVYRGLQVMRDAAYFITRPAELLVEHMQDQAWQEADEHADDWPNVPDAKWAELDKLIHDWLNANVPVTFWTVRNVEKVEVTEELLNEWRAPDTAAEAA
jgi:hypothetical protein